MRRHAIAVVTVGLLLAGSVGASAQLFLPQTLERSFRIEWQVSRARKSPAIDGYVYNHGARTAERVRLQIDRLDASGSVVGHSTVWVLGDVPKDARAYFSASVPEAASYRVEVLSFDWACNGGSGM